jgi:hypothetical protein
LARRGEAGHGRGNNTPPRGEKISAGPGEARHGLARPGRAWQQHSPSRGEDFGGAGLGQGKAWRGLATTLPRKGEKISARPGRAWPGAAGRGNNTGGSPPEAFVNSTE